MIARALVLLAASFLAWPAQAREAFVPADGHYVALGSSFAAGPGIMPPADGPARCARSAANYAHLVAERLRLRLTDASCSGARTAHVLGPWENIPPQIDAVTSDTRLVTITIGGNDVGYIGTLMAASCPLAGMRERCGALPPHAGEAAWANDAEAMKRMALDIRRRAPAARIVFVDYFTVLPDEGTCAATPLPPGQADASRAVARRLAALTARVAAETGAELLRVSTLSHGHDACAADPWIHGYPRAGERFVAYHPTAHGMAEVAAALVGLLERPRD